MENLTNQILRLDDNSGYFVLRQALYKGKTYFFVVGVTEDGENFTNDFLFLEKIDNEDGTYGVEEVIDENVLSVLAKNIKLD